MASIFINNESVYLIWSIEHGAWWGPRECGYTTNIEEAGWYLIDDARRIVEGANIHKVNEAAIPLRMVSRMGAK